ncbi:hypothetical protein HK098_000470 [Nowakowskiella sp. JEL0407]|nr:hypothetical protein HK098_000470 [Nowakowskiella sp. JEL0407]
MLGLQFREFSSLQVFDNEPLVLYRYPPAAAPPNIISQITATSPFFSITRTSSELSVLLPVSFPLPSDPFGIKPKQSNPLIAIKIDAIVDFDRVGVTDIVIEPLKKAEVGVLVLRTFDTVLFLVEDSKTNSAIDIWKSAGFSVTRTFTKL